MTAALVAPDKLRGTATAQAAADAIGSVLESPGVQAGRLRCRGGWTAPPRSWRPRWSRPRPWPPSPGPAEAERASSIGCGQLLAAALAAGASSVLVGLGGSAFSDGGRGALAAIEDLLPISAEILLATDVRTRYPEAAQIYGPQKGADAAVIDRLTVRLVSTADELAQRFGRDPRSIDGTGAAGGLAGALWAIGAELRSGLDIVAQQVNLDQRLNHAELIMTAEGRLDQTFAGRQGGRWPARSGRR